MIPVRATRPINGFCTQIGNDSFAWFGTTNSKSAAELPRSCCALDTPTYAINDAALAYMRGRALAGPIDRPSRAAP